MNDEALESPSQIVAAVADTIGYDAPLANCEWGREFALALMATGDEDAIAYALADAGESYRSRYLSQTRQRSRKAARQLITRNGDPSIDLDTILVRQLSFQIEVPGIAPIPASAATHQLLKEAHRYHSKNLRGQIENNAFLQRASALTEPFPDETLGRLIASGRINPSSLVVEQIA